MGLQTKEAGRQGKAKQLSFVHLYWFEGKAGEGVKQLPAVCKTIEGSILIL
jgi:hypothetical protein